MTLAQAAEARERNRAEHRRRPKLPSLLDPERWVSLSCLVPESCCRDGCARDRLRLATGCGGRRSSSLTQI
jgi:hypothetical protein